MACPQLALWIPVLLRRRRHHDSLYLLSTYSEHCVLHNIPLSPSVILCFANIIVHFTLDKKPQQNPDT